jgi:hypothetical protein
VKRRDIKFAYKELSERRYKSYTKMLKYIRFLLREYSFSKKILSRIGPMKIYKLVFELVPKLIRANILKVGRKKSVHC